MSVDIHFLHVLKRLLPTEEDAAAILLLQLVAASPNRRISLITGNAFTLKGLIRLEAERSGLLDLAGRICARWKALLDAPDESPEKPSLHVLHGEIDAAIAALAPEEPKPKPKAKAASTAKKDGES